MANLKRHSLYPNPIITITQASGAALPLTDYSAKFVMIYQTTLSATVDTDDTRISIPVAAADIVEANDIMLIDHERMQVSAASSMPQTGDTVGYIVSRAYTTPDAAATIYGTTSVSGDGDNIFVLDTHATFSLSVNDTIATAVTLYHNATTDNSRISHLVADVQAAVDSFIGAGSIVVSNVNNKLSFSSVTVGEDAYIAIAAIDTASEDQLGLAVVSDYGEDSIQTTAVGHRVNTTVNVIKIERDAIISDAAAGEATYEWRTGDTNKLGTFKLEFQFNGPTGKPFKAPNDDSFSVTIVADFSDRVIPEGV